MLAVYLLLFAQTPAPKLEGVSRGMLYLILPLDPGQLVTQFLGGDSARLGFLDRLPVLMLIAVWLAAAFLTGSLLMRWLRVDEVFAGRLEHGCFATAVGLQLLSLIVLLLGLSAAGLALPVLMTRWPLTLAIVGLCVGRWLRPQAFQPPLNNRAAEAEQPGQRIADDAREPWWSSRLLWWALPFGGFLIAASILPPWEFDVREYHLQAPKEWYRGGGIRFLPHNVYAGMPLGAEMHALGGMMLWGGERGWWWGALMGKGVIGSMNILTAAGLFAVLRRRIGTFSGAVAAVLYLSWPFAIHVAAAGLIDTALAMYVGFTFLAVLQAAFAKSAELRSWSVIAALTAGAAASCKYPGLLMAVLPGAAAVTAIAVWNGRESQPCRLEWLKASAMFLGVALLTVAPWLAKNAIQTGNPTYPLLVSVFGGETRTPERDQQWRAAHAIPRNPAGQSFTAAQVGAAAARVLWTHPQHHPLLVPLALFAFLAAAGRDAFWAWGGVAVLLLLWFAVTHRIDRFWLPIGPLLCYAAGVGASTGRSQAWRSLLGGLLSITSLLVLTFVMSRFLTPENRILVAYSDLQRDVANEADPLQWTLTPAHDFLNRQTPTGEAVLLVGDAQPFDLLPRTYYSTCFDECLFERWMQNAETAKAASEALRRRGVAFVLVDWSEIDRYRGTYGFSDYVQRSVLERLQKQGVLRRVEVPDSAAGVEVYRVIER